MTREEEKLKLSKGAAFVKSRFKRLRQEDETWEADFRALPKPITQSETNYLGLVVTEPDGFLLTESHVEGRPSVNDLATLLAHAMRCPLTGKSHRPRRIHVRGHHQWRELFPHLAELSIEVAVQKELPQVQEAYEAHLRQLREAHRVGMVKPTDEQASVEETFPAIARWVRGYGHIEIGDQEMFGFVVRALGYGGWCSRMTSRTRWPRRWRRWRRGWPSISSKKVSRSTDLLSVAARSDIMKPGSRDHRHRLLISGDELRELKRHTGSMAEAFGLDRKIENYKGTRPLTLYRWDLDCLMDVIDLALRDERDYPDHSAPGYLALKRLGERLRQEYDAVYGHEEALSVSKAKAGGKPKKKVAVSKSAKTPDLVYQFKITLLDTQPPIWRRIQVQDCTLDKLHEHIQTAMGWTNSHLHHFRIGERLYGDPMLMAENFEEMEYEDSTTIKLSDIIPEGRRRFRLLYEYDFGDSWQHEVLFEKRVEAEAGQKYPLCVDGARACPPEDVGGTWGYAEFVEAIQNEDNERHDELLEWVGGSFDPEAFNPAAATKRMNKGLPDWRRMM